MGNSETFLLNFMEKIDFPQEAQSAFLKLYQCIGKKSEYKERLQTCIDWFMEQEPEKAFEGVDLLAKDMGEHSYTMSMLLLLLCGEPLLERYKEKRLSEELFLDTMKDLTYKLLECWQVYGIWGTFVRSWYPGFYQVARFALGRMQYEYSEFELDKFELNGITVNKGDKVINMHIPSCGSFSEELRLDSYKKAYQFYQKDFGEKPIPMVCSSWLLYPEHKEFLPEHLNIRGFMRDFSYIAGESEDEFNDAWRVFGSEFKKAPKDWPRKTTLQKAYAEHLEKGGKAGSGYGIFLFDGEKIIR
jgi:hypothetical protein